MPYFLVLFTSSENTGVPCYQERQVTVEPVIHECYVGLMCKREPERVSGYLQAAEGYRVQETLDVSVHVTALCDMDLLGATCRSLSAFCLLVYLSQQKFMYLLSDLSTGK